MIACNDCERANTCAIQQRSVCRSIADLLCDMRKCMVFSATLCFRILFAARCIGTRSKRSCFFCIVVAQVQCTHILQTYRTGKPFVETISIQAMSYEMRLSTIMLFVQSFGGIRQQVPIGMLNRFVLLCLYHTSVGCLSHE